MKHDDLSSQQAYNEQVIAPLAKVHQHDCLMRAADHIAEAITILLAANLDGVEPVVDQLRPLVKEVKRLAL